jgi:hypothetical protein
VAAISASGSVVVDAGAKVICAWVDCAGGLDDAGIGAQPVMPAIMPIRVMKCQRLENFIFNIMTMSKLNI